MTVDVDARLLDRVRAQMPNLSDGEVIDAALKALLRKEARRQIAAGALYDADFILPPRRKP